MAKTKISEFNANPALNTDIDSINLAEGCAPSGINDAIRELMSQLKDWQSGTSNDPMVIGSSGSLTLNQGTANGVAYLNGSKVVTSGSALTFDGQTLTNTRDTPILVLNDTVASNSALRLLSTGGISYIQSGISGGSFASLAFTANGGGSEQMRLTSTGLGIGTSSPVEKVQSSNGVAATGANQSVGSLNGFVADYSSGASRIFASRNGVASSTLELWTTDSGGAANKNATLDSSGNLGLGVTPSAWSTSKAIQIGSTAALFSYNNATTDVGSNVYYDGANYKYITTNSASFARQASGGHSWYTAPSGTAGNAITFTQAMTLDASGNLGVGTTSPSSYGKLAVAGNAALNTNGQLKFYNSGNSNWSYIDNPSTDSTAFMRFAVGSGEAARIDSSGNLLVGQTSLAISTLGASIQSNGYISSAVAASTNGNSCYNLYSTGAGAYRFYVGLAGTVYATSTTITAISDQRLKENIRDLDDGLDVVMALKPRKFDWKEGKGQDIKNARGFIAQEFEQVLPDMIEEWRDSAPEGEEPYKAINANLIPTLVKAIQEQQAIIESLKARLDAVNL